MIAFILGLIRNHWLSSLGGVIFASVAMVLLIQHVEIIHLHNAVAECRAENSALAHASNALVVSIQKQNVAIALIQSESEKKARLAAAALLKAKESARKYALKAELIRAQKLTGNECADMRMLVENAFRVMQ